MFLEKLRQKNQTSMQCQQAAHAIAIFFEMQHLPMDKRDFVGVTETQSVELPVAAEHIIPSLLPRRPSQYSDAGYQEKTDSPDWDAVLEAMAAEIKVRHYSRKTLTTYAKWSRSFQKFLRNKPPEELSTADVKEYLTFLAVKCHVAASTQNQAFCSV